MKREIKIKIVEDAYMIGVISDVEYNLFASHIERIDQLNTITDKMADDFYGRMVNKQATIELKEE